MSKVIDKTQTLTGKFFHPTKTLVDVKLVKYGEDLYGVRLILRVNWIIKFNSKFDYDTCSFAGGDWHTYQDTLSEARALKKKIENQIGETRQSWS